MLFDSETNGIDAMRAHALRAGDDNTFVRSIVESYMFLGFGTVAAIKDERMEVSCGDHSYTNVELMVLGVDGWGIKVVPAVNDRVLLFSTQIPVANLKLFSALGTMPPYDQSGIKAIPLTDSLSAQLITVNKDGINITGANKLTVNSAGIEVEDSNGNKITTSSNGVTASDKNSNSITTDANGVVVKDKNDNSITTNSSGVVVEDCNGGTAHNKITTASTGITIVDCNGETTHNSITTTSTGITIEDCNGNTIVSDSTNGVKINNKLQIK